MAHYEVIAGNIGSVYAGESMEAAFQTYNIYAKDSRDGYGRAAGEQVTLLRDGEILREQEGLCDGW